MWDAIEVFWWGLGPELQSAAIGAGSAVLTAAIAATALFAQIGVQARKAIAANQLNEVLKLKLRIYEEIIPVCRTASDAEVQFSSYVRNLGFQVNTAFDLDRKSILWTIPTARFPAFNQMKYDMGMKAIGLITLTERWQIIDPRLVMLRTAINSALHDIDDAWMEYSNLAMNVMPHEVPPGYPQAGSTIPWSSPSEGTLQTFNMLQEKLLDRSMDLGSFIADFQKEMQNLLLGELFDKRVSAREPMDPSKIVLRLDRADELVAHFEKNTAWGRNKAETESRVRGQLANKTSY